MRQYVRQRDEEGWTKGLRKEREHKVEEEKLSGMNPTTNGSISMIVGGFLDEGERGMISL